MWQTVEYCRKTSQKSTFSVSKAFFHFCNMKRRQCWAVNPFRKPHWYLDRNWYTKGVIWLHNSSSKIWRWQAEYPPVGRFLQIPCFLFKYRCKFSMFQCRWKPTFISTYIKKVTNVTFKNVSILFYYFHGDVSVLYCLSITWFVNFLQNIINTNFWKIETLCIKCISISWYT